MRAKSYTQCNRFDKYMNILLSDKFGTKLGTIKTWIENNLNDSNTINKNNLLTTASHTIILQSFQLPNEFQCNSYSLPKKVESLIVWRWFLEKISDTDEHLSIFCKLINPQADVSYDLDSGEDLDAVEIENRTYHLHIGTEDGESLRSRANSNNLMPKRFQNLLGLRCHEDKKLCSYYSFTEYIDFGFKINIPKLLEEEKIYFHFLVATNSIKPSKEDHREIDVSTWLAVERSKRYLDEYLKDSEKRG